ncbi:hypothetical protein PSACC_01544 [Paramicrosporidium saccamoebae]|uniref:Uncharacterized protein n=1 Tax=Paramicrosporidium saccamoebae TaxID=1246581 RepID=A0A2H9TLJ2_9FUNG|nr:hypothetical protein PSACC_01544 [Paramicrosporidium saccamoebae]
MPVWLPYKLDELIERPTTPLSTFKLGDRTIHAGRDVKGGGTWLGLNDRGLLALVTNNRQAPAVKGSVRSRGELPMAVLGKASLHGTVESLSKIKGEFSNFNLLMADLNDERTGIEYISSLDSGKRVEANCFSLSNGSINSKWPKMQYGEQKMTELISVATNMEDLLKKVLRVLTDTMQFQSCQLPTNTTLSPSFEKRLSSVFVVPFKVSSADSPIPHASSNFSFGTVSSSIIIVGNDGRVDFFEISWRELDETLAESVESDENIFAFHYEQDTCTI